MNRGTHRIITEEQTAIGYISSKVEISIRRPWIAPKKVRQ